MKKPLNYSVLIVEDEQSYALGLSNALEVHSKRENMVKFEVIDIVASATRAWEIVKERQPDAVTVDLQLEEGTGFQLLKKIHDEGDELGKKPYKLVVTYFDSEEVVKKVREYSNFIFFKNETYTPDEVVGHLEFMATPYSKKAHKSRKDSDEPSAESKRLMSENAQRILRNRADHILEVYEIPYGSRGRDYLVEAVALATQVPVGEKLHLDYINAAVGEKFGRDSKTIDSAVRRLLNKTFPPSDINKRNYKSLLLLLSNTLKKQNRF